MTKNFFLKSSKKLSLVFFVILTILFILLYRCGVFNPTHKVIKYQEEVKLSDGSFIWVDIKRYYYWSGWSPGMSKGAYMPSIVEISWDTGFEGVGRQTLVFVDDIYLIDKIDGKWYVIGDTYGRAYDFDKSKLKIHNCVANGTYTPRMHISPICLVVLDEKGSFEQLSKSVIKDVIFNIFYADGMNGKEIASESLNGKKLAWQEKKAIQENFPKFIQYVGKTYQAYYDPKEYGYE